MKHQAGYAAAIPTHLLLKQHGLLPGTSVVNTAALAYVTRDFECSTGALCSWHHHFYTI